MVRLELLMMLKKCRGPSFNFQSAIYSVGVNDINQLG